MDGCDADVAALRREAREGAISRQELLRRGAALGLSLPTLGALLAACGGDDEPTGETGAAGQDAEPEIKVRFVYLGPPGDAGWTFQHDEGRKYLEEKLPSVRTTAIENVPEANAGPALDQLIAQGNEVIFATSFGYGDAVLQRARQHPDVIFEHCSGYKRAENVATYYGVHWGAMYLIGVVAGRMTKSDRLGFVGSFPTPDVIVDANAFTLGARSVNPSATTRAVTAVVWNWGPYYVEQVTKAMEGTWKTHDFWGTPEDGTVELAPLGSSVPDDVRAEFDEKYAALKGGSFNPFVGPIKDSKGTVRVPEGEEMSFDAVLRWDWYVEGVEGSLPA